MTHRKPAAGALLSLFVGIAFPSARAAEKADSPAATRPNIIFIFTDDHATQARLTSIIGGSGTRGWDDLCDFALRDGDAWVVQELVHADKEPHLRADPQGVHARDLYVDLSAYANTGVAARPTGGAVRAAESRIVNILGGGGVARRCIAMISAEVSASNGSCSRNSSYAITPSE